ncbi:MAG TPA: 3-hydroxyacyl-CoA dehydrogenase [Usitatibacter sp.]|nr:3-hydroxyacyl-CoA dehydrogenase [Usitatibacter sp.]
MDKIAVIGAGMIGRAWAIVFARAGHPVSLYDEDRAALANNLAAIDVSLSDMSAAGLLCEETPGSVRARVKPAASLEEALAGAVYVQENIREELQAKREVFARMDAFAPRTTLLASSTSTIPASQISASLAGRARCLVAHPVNPPHLVPLVELCPAPWTSPATIERARALLEASGQVPIVVKKEIQGFILNRLQAALLAEAMRLFEDGYASSEDIDKCVRHGLGLRWSFMGPFETIDLNAPGGVIDYARRYGQLLYEIGRTQVARPWSASALQALEAERRRLQPAHELASRQAWRDRHLIALVAHQRGAEKR